MGVYHQDGQVSSEFIAVPLVLVFPQKAGSTLPVTVPGSQVLRGVM